MLFFFEGHQIMLIDDVLSCNCSDVLISFSLRGGIICYLDIMCRCTVNFQVNIQYFFYVYSVCF